MPLYTVAVVVAVILSFKNSGVIIDGLCALLFLNSFTGTLQSLMPYSAVWWSLATEIQFYLVLPMLGLCLRNRTWRMIAVAVLFAWAIAYAAVATDFSLVTNSQRFILNLSIPGRAPAFLFGIAGAWIVLRHGERLKAAAQKAIWLRSGGSDLLLLATLYALGLLLQKVTFRGFIPSEIAIPAWHLLESLLWTVVVLLVVLTPLRVQKLISNRVMVKLGTLSYSLYLIHIPVIFFGLGPLVRHGIPVDADLGLRAMAFGIVLALCVMMSAVTYRFIERPFLVRKAQIDR
jgi:peptidoglycan/LPS O-acetylase OafA/YrhL